MQGKVYPKTVSESVQKRVATLTADALTKEHEVNM
jgi:hypothetical protein